MSVSVIIPAHNEQEYLNRTIKNIFATAKGEIEVIVVLNGYDQEVKWKNSPKVNVLGLEHNEGERVASALTIGLMILDIRLKESKKCPLA